MVRPSEQIHIVLDPEDEPGTARLLQEMHAPHAGVVVADLWLPSRRTSYSLVDQVLGSLGKGLATAGARSNTTLAWMLAQSWFAALGPDHLVVSRAHLWPAGAWARLVELASFCGCQLWLLVQGTAMSRGQREFARDWGIRAGALEELFAVVDIRRAEFSHAPGAVRFPQVADEEFPAFLDTTINLLEPGAAIVVENAYWSTFDAVAADLSGGHVVDDTWLSSWVQNLGRGAQGDLSELVTRLRALQAAAFRHGFLVSIDPEALAAGYTSQPLAAATPENLAALRSVADPRSAALAAIAMTTHYPPPVLEVLNVEDVGERADQIVVGSTTFRLATEATVAVRAHLLQRLWEGARPSDPLFVSEARSEPQRGLKRTSAHGLQQRLRATSQLTGLTLTSRDSWSHQKPRAWLARRQIKCTKLKELGDARG